MLGLEVHACNPELRRIKQEGFEFEASLDYLARLSQKQNEQTKVWKCLKTKANIPHIIRAHKSESSPNDQNCNNLSS
jgi:hypothetical protein